VALSTGERVLVWRTLSRANCSTKQIPLLRRKNTGRSAPSSQSDAFETNRKWREQGMNKEKKQTDPLVPNQISARVEIFEILLLLSDY
jgi:hypothetical protein